MKKINIFNRNINSPSYRRMPVSGGIVENRHTAEARCPGIAIAMTCPAGDFSSQGDEKHNVCDASFCIRKNWVPAFAGMTIIVIAALFATPSFAAPTELDKKTVASKAYVDTKQDIIETGLVEFEGDDATINVPSVVTTNAAGTGVSGNQVGFMTLSAFAPTTTPFEDFAYGNNGDSFVPSAALVAKGLDDMYNNLTNMFSSFVSFLGWNSLKHTAAINAYNTTFGTGTNNWAGNSADLINGQFLAKSLALKQNKIAKSGYYYNTSGTLTAYGNDSNTNGWLHAGVKGTGLVTKTATEGVVGERKIFEATDVANYHATGLTQIQQDIQDISIPTVGAVMSIVNTNAPTGTPGNVAMYDASTGALGDGVATYSGATAQNPYNATNDAAKIATAAAVETKQTKRVCAGYEPGHENEADYCWLWDFPD